MIISNERLEEFRRAYKEDFGEDCTMEEAREMLSRLVTLAELLAKELPTQEG